VFLQIKVDGSHLNLIRAHDGHPDRDGRRCAASRFGLRPPRLAAQRKTYTTSWDINFQTVTWEKLNSRLGIAGATKI
jgi:hypothetical protein